MRRNTQPTSNDATDSVRCQPLPQSWCWMDLAEVVDPARPICYGILMPKDNVDGGVLFVKVRDFKGDRIDLESLHRTTSEIANQYRRSALKPEDVLVSIRGTFGRVAIVPKELDGGNITQDTARVAVLGDFEFRYVAYWLRAPGCQKYFKTVARGVAVRGVNIGDLKPCPVPVAPLNEQRRIVGKIEELFSDLEAGVAALTRARANLKRYRASVLKAAVEGALTSEWRTRHPTTQLVSKPQSNRDPNAKKRAGRLWGAGEVPELTNLERERVPANWCWCKVRDLGTSEDDAVQVGPMSMRSQDFDSVGIPVLNVGCVQWGYFNEAKLDFLPDAKAAAFERYRLRSGDVLFTRSGTVGRCAVAQSHQNGWLMTFHLLRVRPNVGVCNSHYLRMVLEGASHIRRQTREASIGTTRAGFNTNLLADLDIALPSLAEQQQIVATVSEKLSQIESAEVAIEHSLRRAARLRQSILKQAFEGKLVPQDPTDEPASKLLERINSGSSDRDLTTPAVRTRPLRRRLERP